jgi:kumamolisin
VDDLATVSVILRHRTPAPASLEAHYTPLMREDFAAHYGADPNDIDKVRKFASAHGLTVREQILPNIQSNCREL